MRFWIAGAVIALAVSGSASARGSHSVSGYFRSNGTYVAPHYQTNPDSSRANNWSTVGNVNPYTGAAGTKPLYGSYAPAPVALPHLAPSYSPSSASTPSPSAICRDGSPSFSTNHSGTCSHHGGGRSVALRSWVLIAAVTFTTAAMAAPPTAPAPKDNEAPVELNGWFYLGLASHDIYFTRAARPSSYPRIWLRRETKVGFLWSGRLYRSVASLQEVNCDTNQVRSLSSTAYLHSNLIGDNAEIGTTGWDYAVPGSVGEHIADRACGREPDAEPAATTPN